MADTLLIGCDKTISLTGLKAEDTGSYLNAATCSWTLTDSTGTSIASGTLSYVAASNGNYTGTIDGSSVTSTLTDGAIYTFTLTSTQSTYDDKRSVDLVARKRRFT